MVIHPIDLNRENNLPKIFGLGLSGANLVFTKLMCDRLLAVAL